jgi:hypothetical protein
MRWAVQQLSLALCCCDLELLNAQALAREEPDLRGLARKLGDWRLMLSSDTDGALNGTSYDEQILQKKLHI